MKSSYNKAQNVISYLESNENIIDVKYPKKYIKSKIGPSVLYFSVKCKKLKPEIVTIIENSKIIMKTSYGCNEDRIDPFSIHIDKKNKKVWMRLCIGFDNSNNDKDSLTSNIGEIINKIAN
jgi:hypothetical protein